MNAPRRYVKTWIEYLGFLVVRAIGAVLPFRLAGGVGSLLGWFVFRCTPIRKRVTMENLNFAFPELPARDRAQIAKGAYRNYGRAILEMLWEWSASATRIRSVIHLVNPEIAVDAFRRGNGAIILSAHFGSWEFLLATSYFALQEPMTVIVQRQRNRKIDALVDRNRSRFDAHTVDMGQAIREVLRTLKEKGVIFLLGDQSGSKESIFLPFFGRPAATHRGAAAFALRSRAALIMVFLVRRADGTYDAHFEEVGFADLKESNEQNIIELTRRHMAVLERHIRAHPDHWLWMHKRWKHTAYFESGSVNRQQESARAQA